jgi:hypothetical protein
MCCAVLHVTPAVRQNAYVSYLLGSYSGQYYGVSQNLIPFAPVRAGCS